MTGGRAIRADQLFDRGIEGSISHVGWSGRLESSPRLDTLFGPNCSVISISAEGTMMKTEMPTLARRIHAKLRDRAQHRRARGKPCNAGSGSYGRERLAVYRAVRDAGSVPADAGFYLVAWQMTASPCQMPTRPAGAGRPLDALRRSLGVGKTRLGVQ